MKKQFNFPFLFLCQILFLASIAHAQQYLLGPVLWRDTTIQVVEAGSDKPNLVNVSIAYIAKLDLKMLAIGRNDILDFLKLIDGKIPSMTNWKTYVDSACGAKLQFPPNYLVDEVSLPKDPCVGLRLTKKTGKMVHDSKTGFLQQLTLFYTSLSFFEELSQQGLDIHSENELFKSTMAAPIYIESKYYKAVYWQNDRLQSDGSGTMFAQRDEMILVYIYNPSGSSIKIECDVNVFPLLIASTVKFMN
jgi:hypothetical protein